jgi:glycine cleavage system H protein
MSTKYTKDHEYLTDDGTVGITHYAQDQLGDIVFVELPEVGTQLTQFGTFGVVESVKAVSDLYSPVTGEITEVNEALRDAPELLNSDPFGEGWIARVTLSAPDELDSLMDAEAYAAETA